MPANRAGPARIAVLASGGGSNLGAILEYFDTVAGDASGAVVLVASDRADAPALERARSRGIGAVHLADPADGTTMERLLHEAAAELIVLAGYLRLIPPGITRAWHGRIVNVHPTLLPAFGGQGMYGIRAHRAVIASGARVSGVTVHFVDAEYDRGPIIAQWPVPVFPADSAESLAERVLRVEHLLYPRVVDAVARGRIRLGNDNRAHSEGGSIDDTAVFMLAPDEAHAMARAIDRALG